jgi:hypothetical protein
MRTGPRSTAQRDGDPIGERLSFRLGHPLLGVRMSRHMASVRSGPAAIRTAPTIPTPSRRGSAQAPRSRWKAHWTSRRNTGVPLCTW